MQLSPDATLALATTDLEDRDLVGYAGASSRGVQGAVESVGQRYFTRRGSTGKYIVCSDFSDYGDASAMAVDQKQKNLITGNLRVGAT